MPGFARSAPQHRRRHEDARRNRSQPSQLQTGRAEGQRYGDRGLQHSEKGALVPIWMGCMMATQFPCATSGSKWHCPPPGATGTWSAWLVSATGHSSRSSLLPGVSSLQALQCLASQAQPVAELGCKPRLRMFYGTPSFQMQRGTAQPSSTAQVSYSVGIA